MSTDINVPSSEDNYSEFRLLPITSLRTLKLCCEYPNGQANERPIIFIASYPKSGTTWMQSIVYYLITKGKRDLEHISNYSPFFEVDKTWESSSDLIKLKYSTNHESIGFNVFNTHLLKHMMPKGESIKCIYVVRHPHDVVVSFYHHLTNQADSGGMECTFDEFLKAWIDGEIVFGKYAAHLKSWVEVFDSNVLIVKYEDLIADLPTRLREIAEFLKLSISEEDIINILPLLSFKRMKEDMNKYQPVSVPWKEGFEFLRKGVVGDGSSLIGPNEAQLIRHSILSYYNGELPSWFPYIL